MEYSPSSEANKLLVSEQPNDYCVQNSQGQNPTSAR